MARISVSPRFRSDPPTGWSVWGRNSCVFDSLVLRPSVGISRLFWIVWTGCGDSLQVVQTVFL